jgi:mannose-6-phosphate isomerase-like protein (cupin superfamily)
MIMADNEAQARVLRASAGEVLGAIEAVRDRFMIDGADVEGRFCILQHLFPPRALAAPMHIHTREDEWSFVLEGRIGAMLGDDEVVGEVGDLIWKPRNQWHTFWNAGDAPARVLEIISPGGFEESFREMHTLGDALDPDKMTDIAGRYGVEGDFERTQPIIERHKLVF